MSDLEQADHVDEQRDEARVHEQRRHEPPPLSIRRSRTEDAAPAYECLGVAECAGADEHHCEDSRIQRHDRPRRHGSRRASAQRIPERLAIGTFSSRHFLGMSQVREQGSTELRALFRGRGAVRQNDEHEEKNQEYHGR